MAIIMWLILSLPMDRHICSLWLSTPPTVADMRAACPWPLPNVDELVTNAIDRYNGKIVCSRPSSELPTITCDLYPLDAYRFEIVWPKFQEWICSVSSATPPTDEQISAACPAGTLARYHSGTVLLQSSGAIAPPPEPVKTCQLPALVPGPGRDELPTLEELATFERLYYLAGRLIWTGTAHPNCNGWSGLDRSGMANECGMDSAWPEVLEWQNRLDTAILRAGVAYNVPPRRLKALIAQESQFWPLAEAQDGEIGMIQLTANGADVALRYSPDLFSEYCQRTLFPVRCAVNTYDTLTTSERTAIQAALLADIGKDNAIPLYAKVLAAYYCAADQSLHPGWDAALAAYHAGLSCLSGAEVCTDGKEYAQRR
jgi:hypothetical protein